MKITLNVLSVAAAFGLAASAQAQTTLFSTDFENHTLGADNLAGTDNWGTNAVNSGVQGIKEIGGNQFGYLGEASPAANFTEVYQSTPYDPVGQGEPIVNISMDLAIFDSTNFEYDVFFLDIYNQNTDLLGSIVFDNVSLSILSWDADPGQNALYNDTNVDFVSDVFQELDISINYATNRWSASYGSDSLFTNQEFHAGTSDLDYGSLAFTWELPADNTNPGDNYVAFDDILVETVIPEPSTYALIAGVVCLAGVLIRRRK